MQSLQTPCSDVLYGVHAACAAVLLLQLAQRHKQVIQCKMPNTVPGTKTIGRPSSACHSARKRPAQALVKAYSGTLELS